MKYYIVENQQPVGPFEVEELLNRGITVKSLVWTEGMSSWQEVGTVEEINAALNRGVCPPPAPMCNPNPVPPVAPVSPQYGQPTQYGQQPNYGQPQYNEPVNTGLPPKNYLVESILATLFCCLPFGIVGIIKAASVNSLWNQGNREKAYEAAQDAKKWSLVSLIVGVVLGVLQVILAMTGAFIDILGS